MKCRKQVSKRRWKARLRLGRSIPLEAVYNHRLEAIGRLVPADWNLCMVRLA